jgi:AcrR family transcriptional regulator
MNSSGKRDGDGASSARSPDSKAPIRRRGVRTRAQLVRAAQKVFRRDGYLDARVADIAAAAGVAHGSFYTYFDSKEDVFRELAEAVVKEIYAALDTPDETDPRDRVRAINRRYMELYERHALVLGLIEQVGNLGEFHGLRRALRARFVDRVERLIRGLEADGETGPQPLDPHLIASALVGMIDSFAYSWFVLEEPFDRELALANLDAIWLRTLGIAEAAGAAAKAPTPTLRGKQGGKST